MSKHEALIAQSATALADIMTRYARHRRKRPEGGEITPPGPHSHPLRSALYEDARSIGIALDVTGGFDLMRAAERRAKAIMQDRLHSRRNLLTFCLAVETLDKWWNGIGAWTA